LIVYQEGDLSSRAIANSIETNSSAVRGLMVDLKRAGIINTQQGSSEPTLSRPADQITMFDVYQAINMDHDLIHVDPKTNPNCIVGSNIQDTLNEVYQNVEQAAFRSMAETTIQEIIDGVLQRESQK